MPPEELPTDLAKALAADPSAAAAFFGMPPSHRHEHLTYIAEAKKADTRERRIARTLEQLRGRAGSKRAHGQA